MQLVMMIDVLRPLAYGRLNGLGEMQLVKKSLDAFTIFCEDENIWLNSSHTAWTIYNVG